MSKKNNSVVKTTDEGMHVADRKVHTIYTPSREDCGHDYRLATKARFIGLKTQYGDRARKVGTVLNDPEADLVYIVDEEVV